MKKYGIPPSGKKNLKPKEETVVMVVQENKNYE